MKDVEMIAKRGWLIRQNSYFPRRSDGDSSNYSVSLRGKLQGNMEINSTRRNVIFSFPQEGENLLAIEPVEAVLSLPQKWPNKIQNNELCDRMQGCFHNQQEDKSESVGADSLWSPLLGFP